MVFDANGLRGLNSGATGGPMGPRASQNRFGSPFGKPGKTGAKPSPAGHRGDQALAEALGDSFDAASDYMNFLCSIKWNNRLRDILFQIELTVNGTSECETVYWQIDYFVWASGCKTDHKLYIDTNESVYHSIASSTGGWAMTRGKAKGRKPQ